MGLLSYFKRSKTETSAAHADEQRSLADPGPDLLSVFGLTLGTSSGVSVTPATAMRSTAVRAAVQAISEATGYLPCFLYEKGADDSRERAKDHPAYGLVHDAANEWTPAAELREQLTRDALLHGDGLAFINRDGAGTPRELLRIHPTRVTVEADEQTGEPRYTISETVGRRVVPRQNILHIKGPSLNGLRGTSPVEQCKEAIALNLILEAHAARLFGNGGRPSGLLKFPNRLGTETAQRIKASWKAATSGQNAGATAVLEEGGDFVPLTFNSVDSQFLQIWERSVHEIARAFRVPPTLLFELGRATWGNAAEMGATFLRFGLMPWLKRWEGELRLKLLTPAERATHYFEHLTDDLLRSDLAARADAYGKLISSRVLNPNEARARENLPPYPGGDQFLNPNVTSTTGGQTNV